MIEQKDPDTDGEALDAGIVLAPDAMEKAEAVEEDLTEPEALTPRRGHAVLVRRKGKTWIATGVRGHTLQVCLKDSAKRSHYFSALGRKRG